MQYGFRWQRVVDIVLECWFEEKSPEFAKSLFTDHKMDSCSAMTHAEGKKYLPKPALF